MSGDRRIVGRDQRGLTLVELVIFIVVMSTGVYGLASVIGTLVVGSADPMLRKQSLAIAESILLEIEQQPFTFCDPQDAAFTTAASTADCTGGAANSQDNGGGALSGPVPNTESRGNAANPFDNVADYGGYTQTNVTDPIGGNVMNGYTATVAIIRAGAGFGLPDDAVLQIAVTVTRAGVDPVVLTGFRFRYAPRG
jgi:MSHA pilin protein MshD